MSTVEDKYLSNALLNETPSKKINLVLKDGAVTTDKIDDGAVTLDKLGDAVVQQFTVTVDSALSSDSENPVQNLVITDALDDKQDTLEYMTNSEIYDLVYSV